MEPLKKKKLRSLWGFLFLEYATSPEAELWAGASHAFSSAGYGGQLG